MRFCASLFKGLIFSHQTAGEESTGPKFLVFAHHKDVIAGICKALAENKTDFICIDGGVPSGRRQDLVDHFQTDAKCRVAVLSILAAGTVRKEEDLLLESLVCSFHLELDDCHCCAHLMCRG